MNQNKKDREKLYSDVKLIKSRTGGIISKQTPSGSFDYLPADKSREIKVEKADEDQTQPAAIRKLREFIRSEERSRMSKTRAFYAEAKKMESYEDDFDGKGRIFNAFSKTTYEDMDTDALRGYFSFRSSFRRKEYKNPQSENYIYLLICELLMQIGVDNPEEGLRKLYEISVNYPYNRWVYGGELTKWMKDYSVYYALPNKYIRYVFKNEIKTDWALYTFENCEKASDEDIFKALGMLSDYGIESTPFAKKYPDENLHGTAAAIRELDRQSWETYKKTFAAYLNYYIRIDDYRMFDGAVFYDKERADRGSVTVDSVRIFTRIFRNWKCKSYGVSVGIFNWVKRINSICREIDRQLRESFNFKNKLKKKKAGFWEKNGEIEKWVSLGLDNYKREREEAARPVINVDTSKLFNIREDAEYTKESLLEGIEEEFEEDTIVMEPAGYVNEQDMLLNEEISELPENIIEDNEADVLSVLTEDESALLKCLLNGGSAAGFARERHLILSVLVDSLNEKMYDIFADNVVEMTDTEAEIVEDYRDELEEAMWKR